MQSSRNIRAIIVGAMVAVAAPLSAQQTVAPTADPWAPFLGCWSTSSAGVVGPMVCVVPGDSAQRVEFMVVAGDSVAGRTIVDASGIRKPQVRGSCIGWEEASWSRDHRRLYQYADYRCDGGAHQRSDAIFAMTRTDAFTQVEGTITGRTASTSVVNFIVQLDSSMYPVEVKRRLGSLRALAQDGAELETLAPASTSDVIDAATNVNAAVVTAWLNDRGEQTELSEAELVALHDVSEISRENPRLLAQKPQLIVPPARGRAATYLSAGYAWDRRYNGRQAFYNGGQFPTNILVTPAMVGFSGDGSGAYFRGVSFRWP